MLSGLCVAIGLAAAAGVAIGAGRAAAGGSEDPPLRKQGAPAVAISIGWTGAQAATAGWQTLTFIPSGNAERGKQIYVKYGCYQCHGREAQGASTGSRLGPDPWPFAAFVRYARAPRADMPPYTATVMSDAELADVYAFVASRPRPLARPRLLVRP